MDAEIIRDEIVMISKHRLDRCKDLVSLALEQREILISGQHNELADNTNKHELVIADLAKLDRREGALLQELSRNEAVNSVISSIEERRSAFLAETNKEAKKLKSLMQVNAGLLGNAMNYVSFTMGLLSKLVSNQPSYDPRGENATSSAVVLDLRV